MAGTVAVALAGAVVVSAQRDGPSSAASTAAPPPRFVDETSSAGIDHSYEGAYEHFVGGGVAAFDCDDDGLADLYFAGGTAPAALYRNESEVGGAPALRTAGVTGHRSDGGDRRISARRRQRRTHRSRRPAPRRRRRAARARRLPFRRRHRAVRTRRRRRLDHRVQRDVGGHERAADTRVRQLPHARRDSVRRRSTRAPDPHWATATTPERAHARVLHAVDAVQRLGPFGPPGPPGLERPATTTSTARSSCGASAPGEQPRAVHRGRRLAPAADLGHGYRQPRPDRRRLPGGRSSPARATTSCRRSRTGRHSPRTRTWRSGRASPRSVRTRAATSCRRPRGTRSSRT